MRILHLDAGREMRGGQWQVPYLLRGLRERGHAVRLLGRRGGELLGRAADEGIDVAPLGWLALLGERPEVIHAHDAHSHTMAAAAGRVPLVVSRRVAFPVKTGAASRWKYRRAAHFIAISHFVAGRLEEAGAPGWAISVVYDGVPAAAVSTFEGGIVTIATSDPMKGGELLRQAGVEAVYSTDLARDLETARMFVYPTRSEGLGSAALMAMARGVPVIASRVEGLVEAVEDGVTGLLAANHPSAFAAAVERLEGDPGLARRMGEAGRLRVSREFSVDRMVEGTIGVYEKVRK